MDDKDIYETGSKEPFFDKKGLMKRVGVIGIVLPLFSYFLVSGITKTLNPIKQYESISRFHKKINLERTYCNKIRKSYDSLNIFENAENFDDSLEIYKRYGLSIKLERPGFETKERIVKENILESKLKNNR